MNEEATGYWPNPSRSPPAYAKRESTSAERAHPARCIGAQRQASRPLDAQSKAHVGNETNRVIETTESVGQDTGNLVTEIVEQEISNAVDVTQPPPPEPMEHNEV